MPYLVVRKVKGRFYAYSQESYREGGKVRTRTVSYLGAIDPTVASQVRSTRRKLGQLDIKSTKADVKRLVEAATAPAKPLPVQADNLNEAQQNSTDVDVAKPFTHIDKSSNQSQAKPQSKAKAAATASKRQRGASKSAGRKARAKPVQMTIDGHKLMVDQNSGVILKGADKVITIEKQKPTLRPFQDSIKLPKTLGKYGCSSTALLKTHARFGSRLRQLGIDPAHMPDITVKFGHPSGLRRNKDGSFTIVASRKPKQLHPLNKTELWKHYRQALSEGYLHALEKGHPALKDALRTGLDPHYAESKKLAIECIKLSKNKAARWSLSLQVSLWGQIPKWNQKYAKAEEFGQYSFDTSYAWESEIAAVLGEVQKSGWDKLTERHNKTRKKLQSRMAFRRNDWKKAGFGDRLSGKRARFMRELREAETKLQALEQLQHRMDILQAALPGW